MDPKGPSGPEVEPDPAVMENVKRARDFLSNTPGKTELDRLIQGIGAIVIAQGAPLAPTCSAFALATSQATGRRVEVHVIGEEHTVVFDEHGEPKRYEVNLTDIDEEEDTVEAEIVELTPKPPTKH